MASKILSRANTTLTGHSCFSVVAAGNTVGYSTAPHMALDISVSHACAESEVHTSVYEPEFCFLDFLSQLPCIK